MSRSINFNDGINSSTEPTQGNIEASSLIQYVDDAAYEAAELNAPQQGNIYYNTTTNKIRYYDGNEPGWKDSDDESLKAIALLITEQIVQNSRLDSSETIINNNTANITSNTNDISTIQSEQITQDSAIALNTNKISFDEAPQDGLEYTRKDATWVPSSAAGTNTLDSLVDVNLNPDFVDTTQLHQAQSGDGVVNTNNDVVIAITPSTTISINKIKLRFTSVVGTPPSGTFNLKIIDFNAGSPDATNILSTSTNSLDTSMIGTEFSEYIFEFPTTTLNAAEEVGIYIDSSTLTNSFVIEGVEQPINGIISNIWTGSPGSFTYLGSFGSPTGDGHAYYELTNGVFSADIEKGALLQYDGINHVHNNEFMNYSTEEQITGERWIDGRTIYRRVLNFETNVNTNTTIATWDTNLFFIDSFRRLANDEWIIDFFNASGTSNRVFILYNETTGVINTQNIDGTATIEAGTNFVVKYVK